MKLIEMLTPEAQDQIISEVLFEQYNVIKSSILENSSEECYMPIHSYDRDEEDEYLQNMMKSLEVVLEWNIGPNWRSKLENS